MRKLVVAFAIVFAVLLLTQASTSTAQAWAPTVGYHVVRPGQTLYSISISYGLSTYVVAAANGIWNPNVIYVGQVLIIPRGTGYYNPYPSYPHGYPYYPRPTYGCYYWVRYGDTMYSIAAHFGGDAWTIARANGIYNLNWIYAGQRLLIPGCN